MSKYVCKGYNGRPGYEAAKARGVIHMFTDADRKKGSRKGGKTLAQDREHMRKIGRKGGQRCANAYRRKVGLPTRPYAG